MFVVDRIENNIIIFENEKGDIFEIIKEDYMKNIKEGDIIKKENGKWTIDNEETLNRKKYIEDLTKNMWKN